MMDTIIEEILKILAAVILWLILFPVVLIVAAPFILIFSLLGRSSRYPERVADGFSAVYEFWYAWGFWCLPW